MSEEIKEIENTPEKAVYQFGEGRDSLTLSIISGKTTYNYINGSDYTKQEKTTDYIELTLSSNSIELYSISEKCNEDGWLSSKPSEWNDYKPNYVSGGTAINNKKVIAEGLYTSSSKEALAIIKFLRHIEGNPLVDGIVKFIKHLDEQRAQKNELSEKMRTEWIEEEKLLPKKRQEELKQERKEFKLEKQKEKDAKNALEKFVNPGLDSKIKSLKMKILRLIAEDNISSERGVIKPKMSKEEKKNIKLMLDNIGKGING